MELYTSDFLTEGSKEVISQLPLGREMALIRGLFSIYIKGNGTNKKGRLELCMWNDLLTKQS